jgi:hypothetical protein
VDPNGSNGFGDRVFWTVAIPDSDVQVHLGAGRAEMRIDNLAIGDYFTKANAFGANWQTGFVPATVSLDVVWSAPVTRRLNFQDTTNVDRFGGVFFENQATVTWSGTNANGFSFTANPGDFSTSFSAFAELAHVGNGTFFDSENSANSQIGFVAPPSGANAAIVGTTNTAASTTLSLWNSLHYPLGANASQNGIHDSLPALTAMHARPVSDSVSELPSDPAAIWTSLFAK